MSGYVLGGLATFAVFVALVLVFVVAAWLMPRTMGSRTAEIFCPWHRRRVTVRVLTDGEQPIGVISSTAHADPWTVTCGARCVGGREGFLPETERSAELVAD